MASKTDKETGGGDRGLWLQLFPEDLTRLVADRDTFTKYIYPLARWHLGLDFDPPQGIEADFIFSKLKDQQLRSATAQQARKDGGKMTAQKRFGSKQVASEKQASSKQGGSYSNENENENIDENMNDERDENGTLTAFVSPPFSDSVSVSPSTPPPDPADIENAITDTAQMLGDKKPSRELWRDFIGRHGLAAFKEQVSRVLRNGEARNGGGRI